MRAALLLVVTGCFGAGPEPGTPSAATVLFTLELHPLQQDDCRSGRYIGAVAVGGGELGYALTHTFLPACGGGTGNANEQLISSVYSFHKQQGGMSAKIGEAGKTQEGGGPRPKIGASASDALWLHADPVDPRTLNVVSQSGAIGGTFMPTGPSIPASIVIGDNQTYVAMWSGPQGPGNILGPRFPCCGSGGSGNQMFNFIRLDNTTPTAVTSMPVMPHFEPGQIKDTLVASSTTLFYFDSSPGPIVVRGLPQAGGSVFDLGMLANGAGPGGLAASEEWVAWASTERLVENQNRNSCEITVVNTSPPFTPKTLLSTTKWSCTDVALDDAFVYFPIVEVFQGDSGPLIRNRGLGRIDLGTHEFESIALGIRAPEAGPRQVFVDGDGLIVVAPFVIGRIDKRELMGKHEIDN
jgi:hypothetical protein